MDRGRRVPGLRRRHSNMRRRISPPCRSLPSVNALRALNTLNPAKVREKDVKTVVRGLLAEVRALTTRRSCCWPA
jgi:hypothetical protein